jgi:hypothetical protein
MANPKIQKPTVKPDQKKVRFSFEHLQPDHPKFLLTECNEAYLQALLREILRYQNCTVDQFMDMPNEDRRHPISFRDCTTEPLGFPDIDPSEEDLWTDDPWQFGLPGVRGTPSFGWRVHGFIAGNIFYVVWLDPCHRLDSPIENHESTIINA